jgi:hypothetical protein
MQRPWCQGPRHPLRHRALSPTRRLKPVRLHHPLTPGPWSKTPSPPTTTATSRRYSLPKLTLERLRLVCHQPRIRLCRLWTMTKLPWSSQKMYPVTMHWPVMTTTSTSTRTVKARAKSRSTARLAREARLAAKRVKQARLAARLKEEAREARLAKGARKSWPVKEARRCKKARPCKEARPVKEARRLQKAKETRKSRTARMARASALRTTIWPPGTPTTTTPTANPANLARHMLRT